MISEQYRRQMSAKLTNQGEQLSATLDRMILEDPNGFSKLNRLLDLAFGQMRGMRSLRTCTDAELDVVAALALQALQDLGRRLVSREDFNAWPATKEVTP